MDLVSWFVSVTSVIGYCLLVWVPRFVMLAGWFCVENACNILLFGLLNTPMTIYEVLKL
jgi:hypothetical protein